MKIIKNKTGLLLVILLVLTHSNFAQQSDSLAPEATATEATLSFRDIADLKEAFIDAVPRDRKDGIPVGELGIDGGNKAMILTLAKEIADNKYGNFDSFLIAHKGKLIFESYYLRGRINLPHPQASATKAYTSLALGRAIQLGYLTMADLHKPVISFLKDLDPTKFVEGVEKITLHKALTMRSGIHISTEQREELEKNPALLKGQGQVQAFFEHCAPITEASQVFAYKDDPRLVMQVIEAVVPGTAKDFIKKELLDKIGITNYDWGTDISGLPRSGSTTSMISRDMIKWGTLVINKGKWNGEQLVPEAFIAKATSKIVNQSDEYDDTANGVSGTAYGYFWWQADLSIGDKSYLSKGARGGSGQTIIVIEALDLVVVTTTHRNVDDPTSVTATRVLPAFIPNMSEKSDSQDKFPVLEGPYLGQKPPGLIPEVFAPGIVSTEDWQTFGVFTPDLKEFYFIREVGEVEEEKRMEFVVIQNKNNEWQKSVLSPRVGEPFISPDGKTMHLGTKYKERTETGDWSEIKSLGAPFKDFPIMLLTASAKGTYVFDSMGEGILRYSRLINGKREEPKQFGKEINTGKFNAHPFIAPDESYLLWDGRRDSGYGKADVYVSFRQLDGTWGEAINLGDKINTKKSEFGAIVTPDGKYIIFNRDVGKTKPTDKYEDVDIFWVDAQIIENLRPK